jgi:hypothetical protein
MERFSLTFVLSVSAYVPASFALTTGNDVLVPAAAPGAGVGVKNLGDRFHLCSIPVT